MPTEVFATANNEFLVSRTSDGSPSWTDTYRGKKVQTALPIDEGRRCIILLDSDAAEKGVVRNLFCIGQDGREIWTAELPGFPDCFVDAELTSEGLYAHSWSGYGLVLDPMSGHVLSSQFTK